MDYVDNLSSLIKESVKGIDNTGIAFSGGIDSTLIAYLLKEKNPGLYVVGSEGSHDLEAAESAAKILGMELNKIIITKDDVGEAVPIVAKMLNEIKLNEEMKKCTLPNASVSPVSISFNLPLYFVAKHCKEDKIISAQGPDTMFGGFTKHVNMSAEDLKKELEDNTRDLVVLGEEQHKAIGKYFSKNILFPYLRKDILEFSMSLPVEWKIRDGKRKCVLVEASKKLGFPAELAERKKKSAQYGSGIMNLMKKIAKEDGETVGNWVRKKVL